MESTSNPKLARVFACEQCRAGKRKCDGVRPRCSLCQRLSKVCLYEQHPRPRKRKYWDEEYVHGLENQVQALLDVIERHGIQYEPTTSNASGDRHAPAEDSQSSLAGGGNSKSASQEKQRLDEDRSQEAMEELSAMMWRTNLGDGSTIQGDQHSAQYQFGTRSVLEADMNGETLQPPPRILQHCQDHALMAKLATVFLDSVNREHQFTEYRSPDFLQGYPYQPIDEIFLHTAILSVGAAFLGAQDPAMAQVSEDFASYAERTIFDCIRVQPSITALRGLCILSYRCLSLGRDQLSGIFISIAAGLCLHLRLHVLVVDGLNTQVREANEAEIRTFWMFYFIDKSAVTVLGRNCALPWLRANVPSPESLLPLGTAADVADLSFAWQCRLWYRHDEIMDQICSRSFDSLSTTQQVRLLVSTLDRLRAFFMSRPSQLDLTTDTAKPVIFFHLQYHMAVLVMISPFLRTSPRTADKSNTVGSESGTDTVLVLRSITASASESIRLCRVLRDKYTLSSAHSIIAHHLLSASLVHLMNATSSSAKLRRQSAFWLRSGMEMLEQIRVVWPTRAERSIMLLRVLAQKWKATGALPLRFSGPVDYSATREAGNDAEEIQETLSGCESDEWLPGLGDEPEAGDWLSDISQFWESTLQRV